MIFVHSFVFRCYVATCIDFRGFMLYTLPYWEFTQKILLLFKPRLQITCPHITGFHLVRKLFSFWSRLATDLSHILHTTQPMPRPYRSCQATYENTCTCYSTGLLRPWVMFTIYCRSIYTCVIYHVVLMWQWIVGDHYRLISYCRTRARKPRRIFTGKTVGIVEGGKTKISFCGDELCEWQRNINNSGSYPKTRRRISAIQYSGWRLVVLVIRFVFWLADWLIYWLDDFKRLIWWPNSKIRSYHVLLQNLSLNIITFALTIDWHNWRLLQNQFSRIIHLKL